MRTVASKQFKEVRVEAVKITADGKRIPLGTIGYWHRNPLKRLFHKIFGG